MMWALVIIVVGLGSAGMPETTVIDFPTQGSCEKARDAVIESGVKVRAEFAVSCVQRGGILY